MLGCFQLQNVNYYKGHSPCLLHIIFQLSLSNLLYRFSVPAHALHSEGPARDHLDRPAEVRLWRRPGAHAGVPVSIVSSSCCTFHTKMPLPNYSSQKHSMVLTWLCLIWVSVFLCQTEDPARLHHRAEPQCVPLFAGCLWQARQSELIVFTLSFIKTWHQTTIATLIIVVW